MMISGEMMANDILKVNALKNTRSRQIVLHIIEDAAVSLTAEDIYARAFQSGEPVTLSTVYRTLSTLSEKGVLLKSISQDGKTYYQLSSHQHKHRLVCTICNEIILIENCPLESLEAELEKKTGYTINGHSLEFCGICPKCAKKAKNKA